uniref:Uncharacterized protein n=1 Tax=Toxoplasma gondii TgCATBr9 TaxID=943120 RepID=A0A2T6ILD2_TOXGO|nr:hypothetical protein TGBR9_383780 [Toxoplasma gondii TgCATBr9]
MRSQKNGEAETNEPGETEKGIRHKTRKRHRPSETGVERGRAHRRRRKRKGKKLELTRRFATAKNANPRTLTHKIIEKPTLKKEKKESSSVSETLTHVDHRLQWRNDHGKKDGYTNPTSRRKSTTERHALLLQRDLRKDLPPQKNNAQKQRLPTACKETQEDTETHEPFTSSRSKSVCGDAFRSEKHLGHVFCTLGGRTFKCWSMSVRSPEQKCHG